MTLKTSFFNKGIYKNTLSRFKWGAILYFVMLFCAVPYALLTRSWNYSSIFIEERYMGYFLTEGYMVFPLLLAVAVPTITGVLIFHSVHSEKQCTFLHSLPITRKESYISQVLAGLTLMFLPVIANGIILFLMSVCSDVFSVVIGVGNIFYWIMLNCVILFVMFSVTTFAAFITGNGAAHIVVNILIHCIAPIAALAIIFVSDVFLFGFVQAVGFISNLLIEKCPIVWMCGRGITAKDVMVFGCPEIWWFIIGSVVLYGLTYLVYCKRKVETCGEVAAFKCLKPVFKYGVTFIVTIIMSNILYYAEVFPVFMIAMVAVIGAITYFACEMLLGKTFKVFKKYKGYLVYLCVITVITLGFAYTSVFGYETRVPEIEEVKSAAIFDGYLRGKTLTDEGLIKDVISSHNEILKEIDVIDGPIYHPDKFYGLFFAYELENGKTLNRRYNLTQEQYNEFLGKMYEYYSYKALITELDNVNVENVDDVQVRVQFGSESDSYDMALYSKDIMKALVEDLNTLGYEELRSHSPMYFNIRFECSVEENKYKKYFKDMGIIGIAPGEEELYKHHIQSFNYEFNTNHANILKVLEDAGYLENMENYFKDNLYIYKDTIVLEERGVAYEEYKVTTVERGKWDEISLDDCVKLNDQDSDTLFNYIVDNNINAGAEYNTEYYCIVQGNRNYDEKYAYSKVALFTPDELPEYLKKYLN